jgi:hypothetical protein
MATAADVATKVLDGLRRTDTFAPNTDDYHALLLQFINQAMNEVQEAWDWQVLRKTVTVTGVASQAVYGLDSAADADIDIGPEGKIMYWNPGTGGGILETSVRSPGMQPQVWDTTTATAAFPLKEVSPEQMEYLHISDTNQTAERPGLFAIYRDNDDIFMKVHPTPTGIRTWQLRMLDPQVDIAKTDTMANITMQVPVRPVWMKALAYALVERGETEQAAFQADRSEYALQSSIALERTDIDDTGFAV